MKIGSTILQWIRLPKQPSIHTTINGQILNKKLFSYAPQAQIHTADNTYHVFKTQDLMPIFKLNCFSEMSYVPELRDCDDFTWAFVGMMKKLLPGCTVGLVWADFLKSDGSRDYRHSFCFFIDENLKLVYVEPQSNACFSPTKRIKPYLFIT